MRNFFNQVMAGINSRFKNALPEQPPKKIKRERIFVASKTTTINYSKFRRDPSSRWK